MKVVVLGTRAIASGSQSSATSTRSASELIRRRELPYWEESGWQRSGGTYAGAYHTPFGAFLGRVETRWGDLHFYMNDPPSVMRRSSHWACFQPVGERGFHLHMARRPKDVSSGILAVERLLMEAYRG